MRLSSKQALVMFEILKWSIDVKGFVAGFDSETRLNLVNQIIQQQGEEIIDLDKNSNS